MSSLIKEKTKKKYAKIEESNPIATLPLLIKAINEAVEETKTSKNKKKNSYGYIL